MYIDITNEWKSLKTIGVCKYCNKVVVHGKEYHVGDNGVTQEHDDREKEVANILAKKYGYAVELMPDITGKEEQQHIQMPDYLLNGVPYEYKRIYGNGKNTLVHAAINGKLQSHNIMFDISYNKNNQEELINKTKLLYNNKYTNFVDIVVIICEQEIIKVFRKKEEDPHPDNKM